MLHLVNLATRCWVDWAVSAPHAPTYLAGSISPLATAVAREQSKESKHGADVRDAGNTFTPAVLESYGAMGPRLRAWFQRMIDAAAVQAEDEREEAAMRGRLSEEWQRRISMALQRGNARIIISRSRQARDRLGTRVGRAWGRARDTELDFGEGQ